MIRKTVLITGSTLGIGFAGAEALGRKGWRVLVHGRSPTRLDPAVAQLRALVPEGEFEGVTGDLASLAAVADLAGQVQSKVASLDALWNNAGGMSRSCYDGRRHRRPDGRQLRRPLRSHSTPSRSPPRRPARQNRHDEFHGPYLRSAEDRGLAGTGSRNYRPMAVYGQSKLATLLFTEELARRIGRSSVTVNAYHPGFVRSGFGSGGESRKKGSFAFASFLALSPEKGADTGVWLIDDPSAQHSTGRYWIKRKPKEPSSAVTPETARLVWTRRETAVRKALGALPE